MSGYGRNISVGTWGDEKFCRLSAPQPNAQTFWLYLLTGPETTNMPGVLLVGRVALAEALGWSVEDVTRCADEVEAQGMIRTDWAKRIIWMPKALKHSYALAPDNVKALRKPLESLPDCELKIAIYDGLLAFITAEAQRNPKQQLTLEAFLQAIPRPTYEGTPAGPKTQPINPTPPAARPPTPPGGQRTTPPQVPVPVKDPVSVPGGGKGRPAAAANGTTAKEASSKKAPPPPTKNPVGSGESGKPSAFQRFQARRKAKTGRTPESAHPGDKEFEISALSALKREGWAHPETALDMAMDAFFADPKPHWKLRGFPWAAFRKQWEDYKPTLAAEFAPASPPPPAWAATEAGAVWLGVLNFLQETGRGYAALTLCKMTPSFQDGELVLDSPDRFAGPWIQEHYGSLLEEVFNELHPQLTVRIEAPADSHLRLVQA